MTSNRQLQGVLLGLLSYLMWGCFPLFFHLLSQVHATEVLTHRIIWSSVFVALLLTLQRRWPDVRRALVDGRSRWLLLGSSLLIAVNWGVFIWSVSQHRVLESSLGYFLNPLVSVLLGMLFLGERLGSYQRLAVVLAGMGVGWQIWQLGRVPWIPLVLATSFGFYGLVRKQVKVDSVTALLLETLWLLPLALAWLGWLAQTHQSHFLAGDGKTTFLLILSGVVTALPLLTFAAATARLQLGTVGFLMYINPTMQFLTAVVLLGETLRPDLLFTFVLIWLALAVFTLGALREYRRRLPVAVVSTTCRES